MHMFRSCRDQTAAEHLEPLTIFKLPQFRYEELLRELESDQSLRAYVEDKVR
jgi:hypothetical protein